MNTTTTPTKKRVTWVDYAKGIGIFFVVALHVINGIAGAGLADREWLVFLGISWTNFSFNMPIFFFAGGLFIARSVDKRTYRAFGADKLRTIAYPYFVWSIISLAVGTLVANTNSGVSLSANSLVGLLYEPVLHYWFLYVFFWLLLGYAAMRKANIANVWFLGITVVLFIIGQYPRHVLNIEVLKVIDKTMEFSVFFGVGLVFSQQIRDFYEHTSTRNLLLLMLGSFALWVPFVVAGPQSALAPLQSFAAAMGLTMVLTISALLARYELATVVRYLGTMSMEVYLLHVLAGAGFRIVLASFLGITNTWVHVVGGISAAIIAPIIFTWVVDFIGFRYAYTWPRPDESGPAHPVESRSTAPSVGR